MAYNVGMQTSAPSPFLIPLIFTSFVIFFPILWLGITALISVISGYGALARKYPGQPQLPPGAWTNQTGSFGTSRYKKTLTIGVTPEGLFLWVMFLFRFQHPPIFVPWNEVEVGEPQSAWGFGTTTEVTFPQLQDMRIQIGGKAGEAVAEAKQQSLGGATQPP
jgi:hypothetical protein